MRSYLIILSILSLLLSSPVEENKDIKDYIEIAKCFLDQQPLIDDVNSLITMITNQDFSQAITLAFKTYADVQSAITKCIKKEINLEGKMHCCMACNGLPKDSSAYKFCSNRCGGCD